jgi:nucleoside phosphorylase
MQSGRTGGAVRSNPERQGVAKRAAFLILCCFAGLTVAVAPAQASSSPSGSSGAPVNADFNGDSYADLAVGVPLEDVGAIEDAGAVNVLYGSATGLRASGSQFWHQDIPGMEGDGAEPGDRFGSALAAGDFDGDGFADLAIGAPFEGLEPDDAAGAVNVLYGAPSGLVILGNQSWTQGSLGLGDADTASEAFDLFGFPLAAANFGKSAHDDLAVGVIFEDMGAVSNAGAANVIYGTASGLDMSGAQFWHQDSPGVLGDGAEEDDSFAYSLAAANFGKSTHADLAIGVRQEDLGTITNAGAVNVLYGSSTGLTASGDQFWHQNSSGILDAAEEFDYLGSALAAANFGKSAQADLAIGAEEDIGTTNAAGAVNVLYGSSTGLTASGDQFWHQNSSGILDAAEQNDFFGIALAAADFGKSTQADLAIGVAFEALGTTLNTGAVNVIYGSSTGLTASGNQFWHQNSSGILDAAEQSDQFGYALAAADFGKSAQADLAVGARDEALGAISDAGAVNAIYGSSTGLTASGDQFWHQNVTGVAGDGAEAEDSFGIGLAAMR